LEDRHYDAILFRNGYAMDAPEMLVEFRGLRRYRRALGATALQIFADGQFRRRLSLR
jgi:hypothetical protein